MDTILVVMPDKADAEVSHSRERDQRGRRKANEPEAVFEIQEVDGEEGKRLAEQQARVFYEIAEWCAAQQQPPDSPDDSPISSDEN